jgi:exosome complex exonuclease RRP6
MTVPYPSHYVPLSIHAIKTPPSNMSEAGDNAEALPSLPKLLAALALGARSVNNLPISPTSVETDNSDDENGCAEGDEEDDEFSFHMSLPEFASLNNEARRSLTSLLCRALEGMAHLTQQQQQQQHSDDDAFYEFEDPELWERCADACDALLDRVTAFIYNYKNNSEDPQYQNLVDAIGTVSSQARNKASGAYGRMIQGLASMEKPQNIYQGFVTHPPQNSRGEPFVPIVFDAEKQALVDAGEFNRNGHGLDSRYASGESNGNDDVDITRKKYASDMVAPNHHYDHPYRENIEALEYRPWQLDISGIDVKNDDEKIVQQEKYKDTGDHGVWIDKEDELSELAQRITQGQEDGEIREIALDLEAHSHRSFAGFVCLIQLSIRRPEKNTSESQTRTPNISSGYDFLIDALSLRHAVATYLGPILANPNIVKVMHGADSDIPWLQRDFGCYVVNLFDTGRASRILSFPSAGLAYLLRKYVGIDPDKTHQLSDWRRRPLPEDMREYAVSDTRYLLDIYDRLRVALENHSSSDVSIVSVLDRSKQVCLIRYDKEPFKPSGYLSLMDGGSRRFRNRGGSSHSVTSELSSQQEATLRALYDWRDKSARQEDESVQYVCPNAALLRVASNRPVTVAALQRLVNPLPPLVMRKSQEILDVIKNASASSDATSMVDSKEKVVKDVGVIKSAVPTPHTPTGRNREMLSPILGSDALYKQSGWLSSDSEEEQSSRKVLDVNSANRGYSSSHYLSHSIEMTLPPTVNDSETRLGRGHTTDGHGTARAALSSTASINDDLRLANKSASLIQNQLMESGEGGKYRLNLIDLIRPIPPTEDFDFEDQDDKDDSNDSPEQDEMNEDPEDDVTIPKSMREIYNLSNANRRQSNKDKEQGTTDVIDFQNGNNLSAVKMKEDDMKFAESCIASRGGRGGYFKKQKTSVAGSPGKDGDIKLMIKMGWVKSPKDAESLAVLPDDVDDKDKNIPNQKKPGKESTRGGTFNLLGAFDPNSLPSKNPFFAGAATSAASMLDSQQSKSNNKSGIRRNKKGGRGN